MNNEWLTAESLRRNQRFDFPDNTLSIYTKLAREASFEVPEIGMSMQLKGTSGFWAREPMTTIETDRAAPLLGQSADEFVVRQLASTRRQRPRSILIRFQWNRQSNC